jgi:hypothetical protein
MQAASSARSASLARPPPGELVADELAIVAVDHRREMRPPVRATVDVGDVHRPPLVAPTCTAPSALHAGPRRRLPLMDKPALEHQHAVHGFPIDRQALVKTPRPLTRAPPPAVRAAVEPVLMLEL